jgi:hypothetical protein
MLKYNMVIIIQLVKKFHAFNGTQRFFIVLTIICNLSWLRATRIQFTVSHAVSLRLNMIYSHLSSICPLSSSFSELTFVCISLPFHMCSISCASHRPWVDHPHIIWRGIHIVKLLICSFLLSFISSFLVPNIILTTLFSNTYRLGLINMRRQVWSSY